MSVRRNSVLLIVLAALGAWGGTPTRAFAFEWPSFWRAARCPGCGRPLASHKNASGVIYRAGTPYHAGCMPAPTPVPIPAPVPFGAPAPLLPPPEVPRVPSGEPAPERPSMIPEGAPATRPEAGPTETAPPPSTAPSTSEAETSANAAEAYNEAQNASTAESSGLGGGVGSPQGGMNMFGDLSPFSRPSLSASAVGGFRPPAPPEPPGMRPNQLTHATIFNPAVRSFKMADNQTPMPVDRFSFSFNFFDYVNQSVNQRFNVPINRVQAYRYIFGWEKTVLNARASFGFRLPLNNVVGNSNIPGLGQSSTSLGDLTAYFKYALLIDRQWGRVLTAGMAVTMPTGPSNFAGADWLRGLHYTNLQPFLAFQWTWDRLYAIGFASVDVPTSQRDALMLYQDLGLGYFIYRNRDPNSTGLIKAVSPIFEVHVNTPTNHRDIFNARDIAGTAEVVDLTSGLNVWMGKRTLLSIGIVDPVTGPRPFSLEALALLNVYYGGRRGRAPSAAGTLGPAVLP